MSLCSRCRKLISSGAAAALRITSFGGKRSPLCVPSRQFSLLPDLPNPISAITEKRKDFSEERILGYSLEDVFKVISDVNSYKLFLPWCKDSVYLRETPHKSIAKLVVGFPPLLESYTAVVHSDPPFSMRTVSTDGRLFTRLENHWQLKRGPDMDSGPTCVVGFWVRFEFRSLLYAQLGSFVFDEVARTMSQAFEGRCQHLFGPDHLKTSGASLQQLRDRLRLARTPGSRPCESS